LLIEVQDVFVTRPLYAPQQQFYLWNPTAYFPVSAYPLIQYTGFSAQYGFTLAQFHKTLYEYHAIGDDYTKIMLHNTYKMAAVRLCKGARGIVDGWGAMLQAGRSLDRVPMRSSNFFQLTQSFSPHYGPGVDSACNGNEYQKMFLESIARPARKADNLTVISELTV
jgi:hypothetical protein